MASGKAVNISQLSLPHLDQVKTQLEQEVNFLTTSMQQLKAVQQRLTESKESLEQTKPENNGKTILVPLTGALLVPGKLKDADKVMVDVGTGYYVEKTTKEAEEFFQRKIEYVTKNLEKLQKGLVEKHKMREGVMAMMQAKVQAQLAAQRPQ